MRVGDFHLDLRDRAVVRIEKILYTNDQPGVVEVVDVPKGFTFLVEAHFLSPRALDPASVLDWLKHG